MDSQFIFTDFCNSMNDEEREVFNRTVVMDMDTPAAAKTRAKYYKSKLRHMGENVKIGTGVKIVNPQFISLGNNVSIGDNCILIAHSERGIELDDNARLKNGVYLELK